MDVLLHLISQHKLNILDIEISELLDQYMAYLDQCRQQDFDLAGEFLDMAARLIYIKTASLLPQPEEAQKEKEDLEWALLIYAQCKQAVPVLRARDVGADIFCRAPMQLTGSTAYSRKHPATDLCDTWARMGKKQFPPTEQMREKLSKQVTSTPKVTVMSKITEVMRKVRDQERVYLESLYADVQDRSARVALFLAILELTRHGRVGISEDSTYIYRRSEFRKYRRQSEVS